MIRHVVMFRWADSVGDDAVAAVTAGLDALPGQIDVIRRYEHGRDLGLSDTTLDYVLVADFDSVEDFVTYRDHPVHRAFIDEHITGAAVERLAVQYEVD